MSKKITRKQMEVLTLIKSDPSLSQSEMARSLNVSVSALIARLESLSGKGIIEIIPVKHVRYKYKINSKYKGEVKSV